MRIRVFGWLFFFRYFLFSLFLFHVLLALTMPDGFFIYLKKKRIVILPSIFHEEARQRKGHDGQIEEEKEGKSDELGLDGRWRRQ